MAVDAFRRIGINIDEQNTDWGTVVQRRTSKEPVDKGGWSMFPAGAPAPEFVDPMLSNPMRSNGAKAWFGWPDNPKLEAAYAAWLDAGTTRSGGNWKRTTNSPRSNRCRSSRAAPTCRMPPGGPI